jgi:GDP-L-fucose synthase
MDWSATKAFFLEQKPDAVIHLAARVYGIGGNMAFKGVSYFDNTQINTHVVEAARLGGTRKIIGMGSGCVYPFPSPDELLQEETMYDGRPHPSEDSYAHSKRGLAAQLAAYHEQYEIEYVFTISGNLYGPYDKFDTANGHVTPSLVRKFYESSQTGQLVEVWGDGSARRDFSYSEDIGDALVLLMEEGNGVFNLGTGQIHSIREIVEILSDITGLHEKVVWDREKPNGQAFRAYNLNRLFALGFKPKITLREGLERTFQWYAKNFAVARR